MKISTSTLFLLAGLASVLTPPARADRLDLNFNRDWSFHLPAQGAAAAPRFTPPASDRVAEGAFPGGTAAQIVNFPAREARFVCLEITSAHQGPFASVAEFDLLDEQGKPLDRSAWKIAYVDSEEADSGEVAANVLDGKPETRWHTQWKSAQPGPVHALVLDLGATVRCSGFRYLPRQDGNSSGMSRDWRLYARLTPFALPSAVREDAPPPAGAEWEAVCLPHTPRLEALNASGGRNFQGICWYRKTFPTPAGARERKVLLVFEGAMQVADLWLNGRKLTTHAGGYLPFTVDLGDALRPDAPNELLVRLDNRDNPEVPPGTPQGRLDFTYFGGLYRNVRLVVLDRLHVTDEYLADKPAGGGIFVRYPKIAADQVVVEIRTEVVNGHPAARTFQLKQELVADAGAVVAETVREASLAAGAEETFSQTVTLANPRLWHPDHPALYTLRTSVLVGAEAADRRVTRIGLRRIEFKPEGLFINGGKVFASGFNRHQDHPYVGYALPDSAHWRDAKKMREAGFTSFRSHYPPAPAFMDACDEFGILCVVSNPGWQFYGNGAWEQRLFQNAREMVRRDRNHPCVALYEPFPNETGYGEAAARTLYQAVHAEQPGGGCFVAGDAEGAHRPFVDVAWSRDPVKDLPYWGREWGDSVDNWGDQQGRVRVARGWGEVPMITQALNHAVKLDTMLRNSGGGPAATRLTGAGVWAGIDCYRGYHQQPFLGGALDLFRLPKFDYYFFQSQRDPAVRLTGLDSGSMVFIANTASACSPADVTVFSNCEQVRFYENGKLLETRSPDPGYVLDHPPFTFRAKAATAAASAYKLPGDLAANSEPGYHYPAADYKAEGLIGGKVVAAHSIRAAGVMSRIVLEADLCGRDLAADGADWVRVYAKICDGRGTVHPFATDPVTFSVEGAGAVIGDATIGANPVNAEAGIATALIRATTTPGKITVRAESPGLTPGFVTLESRP